MKTHRRRSWPTAASSSTSTRRDDAVARPRRPARPAADADRLGDALRRRCSTSGWRSPRTARAARTCRRATSARCARRPTTGRPRSRRTDYDVVVFENRFPSFATTVDRASHPTPARSCCPDARLRPVRGGLLHVRPRRSFAALPPERVRTVVEAWVDRTAALSALPDVEQVFCFENRGEEIGVTLHHPHGQIYAYPFVTPRTRAMLERRPRAPRAHRRATCSPTCWPPSGPTASRVVPRNEHWTAFVPAAARWPFEVHLVPAPAGRRPAGPDRRRSATRSAPLYLDVLRRLDALFDAPDAVHLGLAPGAGARRPRPGLPAPAAVPHPAGGRAS